MPWHFPATPNSGPPASHRPARAALARLLAGAMALAAATAGASGAEQTFDCVIDPAESVKLGSPVVGILSEVVVKRGDTVTRGQIVARLESSVDAAAVNVSRFKAESTARITAQQARLALAQAKLALVSELVQRKIEAMASNKFEEARAEVRVAEQELVREEQDRKLNELELARAVAVLEERTIRSTVDGIVTEKKLSAGEFINQEGYIAMLARLDPLHVEVFLPVSTFKQISIGMQGTVQPAPPIGGSYAATVTVVDRVFDPSSATFGVRLTLPNPDNRLPGGQRCKVTFDISAEQSEGVVTAEPAMPRGN
jgi:RND family efflux transporter MFP subunit